MTRLTAAPRVRRSQFLLDNFSGAHSAGNDFQVQEPAFRPAKEVLLPGIEDLQIFRENRSLRIADAESPGRLLEGVSREALALGPHIISAQLAQRIGHKFGGDSLAPGHVEIGVVERLGDSSRVGGRFSNRLQIQGAAQKRFCRIRSGQRTAG